jgi:hypothetical protein
MLRGSAGVAGSQELWSTFAENGIDTTTIIPDALVDSVEQHGEGEVHRTHGERESRHRCRDRDDAARVFPVD